MNKFKTDINGGLPLYLDDFRWFLGQNTNAAGLYNALYSLCKSFQRTGSPNFIISGCEATVSSNDLLIAEGFVFLNDEILKVDAHTVSGGGISTDVKIEKATTYDSAGLKTFNNTTINNTYQKDRGVGSVLTRTVFSTELSARTGFQMLANKLAELKGISSGKILESNGMLQSATESKPIVLLPSATGGTKIAEETRGTAFNKNFGSDAGNIIDIASIIPNSIVYINSSGKLQSDIFNPIIRRKELSIPLWNMDTDATFTKAHGIADITKIYQCYIIIYNNINSFATPLDNNNSGSWRIDSANIRLTRNVSGDYDNVNYDAASGRIVIDYTD